MRREPVTAAYRAFSRHVGLDPDVDRTPLEAVVVERLMHGGLRPRGRVEDALLVGALETGVPLWALDADRLKGRPASARRPPASAWGRAPAPPTSRRAGSSSPTAAARSRCSSAPSRTAMGPAPGPAACASSPCRVAGVPQIHVEEALWACTEALAA